MRTSPLCSIFVVGALLSLAAAPALLAQSATATTEPVGFMTLNIAGTGGGPSAALSFKSLSLAPQVEYQGNAEQIVNPTTIKDTDAAWTDNQFNGANGSYYLEIIGPAGGAGLGTTYDITGTSGSAQTVTLAQSLAAGVTTGANFRIRKHWTIASVFGTTNQNGLTSGASTTADVVRIYSADGSFTGYFYSNSGDIGWRQLNGTTVVTGVDKSGTIIYPDDGLVIVRQQSAGTNVVLMGSVKTGQTSSPVLAGVNVLSNPYAAAMTLGDSGLYTGDPNTGVAAGSSSKADLVQIYNGASYDSYFYSSGGAPGIGWRKTGSNSADQAGVQIPAGSSIVIQRKNGAPFNWVAPQHPASF